MSTRKDTRDPAAGIESASWSWMGVDGLNGLQQRNGLMLDGAQSGIEEVRLGTTHSQDERTLTLFDSNRRIIDPDLARQLLGSSEFHLLVDNDGEPVRTAAHGVNIGDKCIVRVRQLLWGTNGHLYAVCDVIHPDKDGKYVYKRLTQPIDSIDNLRPLESVEPAIAQSNTQTHELDFTYVDQPLESVYLDSQEGIDLAINCLEKFGIAIVDFGSTWGIVFRPDRRELVADLRGERTGNDTKLAYASLVASESTLPTLVPEGVQPGTTLGRAAVLELISLMKGVGFVRFTPDFSTISEAERMLLDKHFTNEAKQAQFYPVQHPLFEAWEKLHPEDPVLGVRSANPTGSQEQAFPTGARRLAELMGVPVVAFLSRKHEELQLRDETTLALPADELGLHKGRLSNQKTKRGRHGSVPIVVIAGVDIRKDPKLDAIPLTSWWYTDGQVVVRGGLVDSPVSIVCERIGNVSPEALLRLLSGFCKKYGVSAAINTGSNPDFRTAFAPAGIELSPEVLDDESLRVLMNALVAAALWIADEPQSVKAD